MGGDSKHFSIEMGLCQGSMLSPFLFALVMDELAWSTGEEILWCVLFADDTVLIDETQVRVNYRLEIWRLRGLEANSGVRRIQIKQDQNRILGVQIQCCNR